MATAMSLGENLDIDPKVVSEFLSDQNGENPFWFFPELFVDIGDIPERAARIYFFRQNNLLDKLDEAIENPNVKFNNNDFKFIYGSIMELTNRDNARSYLSKSETYYSHLTDKDCQPHDLKEIVKILVQNYNSFAYDFSQEYPKIFEARWLEYRLWQSLCDISDLGRHKDETEDFDGDSAEFLKDATSVEGFGEIISECKGKHNSDGKPRYKLLDKEEDSILGLMIHKFENKYNKKIIKSIWDLRQEKAPVEIDISYMD